MKEFDNLKLKGLSDYGNHLIAQSYIDFEELLFKNQVDAYRDFQKLIAIRTDPDILQKISNPFYVGMGNPKSKILIFGQELAIDLDKTKISSLEGFFQEQLYHHPLLKKPEPSFFDPYRANNFRKIKRHSHTWGVYSKWVAAFMEGDAKKYKNYLIEETREKYFEDYCFYTELYEVPSPKHKKSMTTNERERFFQSKEFRDFFATFDYVLIGCASFHKEYINLLEKYFGVKEIEIMVSTKHPHLNKKAKPYIMCELIKTKREQKFAIFNNQFSSAWKYDYINEIVSILKTL